MNVTLKQITDPVFVNQLLHRPLRAKIMTAIALILLVGGVIAAVVANSYGHNWSDIYTIAPWTVTGASFVALIALRIWFNKIYCCKMNDARDPYDESKVNKDLNRTYLRHKDKNFTPTQGVALREYIEKNFPRDSKTILHMAALNSGGNHEWHILQTWIKHKHHSSNVGPMNADTFFELIEKNGALFLKLTYTATYQVDNVSIGTGKYTTLTDVGTAVVAVEFEFP